MGKFRRDERGGDRGGFRPGGGKGFANRDKERPAMHQAICSSCHKSCEVPFRPTGDKPVYCRDCFAGRAAMGGDRSRRPDPRSFKPNIAENVPSKTITSNDRNNDELKKQLEGVNAKLERLISSVQHLSQTIFLAQANSVLSQEPVKQTTPAKKEVKKVSKKISKKK